ncbi:ABC transporter transmembrane domain-containing protein [Paracoccus sp. CPCC 101403]|uniref:ABC transporter transmembrane domain-containing protein n=1 Tax=Paracoccus broussonetiae TaxID=3075834 RepID=A0ABU3EHP7_9RHOB|nr:ABC transporter transmembrane domain-containing protein [Paracoccus sp. CPCC 101403]MDT1063640.1 ABC transporter transmembrane domain-containing protein [Paracoccus sp. CPCC 101403]
MEQGLTRFIWTYTRRSQIWILFIVVISMIPYYISFDLPKQIVNGPIQGQGFETATSTQIFMRIAPDLPVFGQVVLFEGVPLERMPMLMALSFTFLSLVIINGLFKYYINTFKGRMGERLLRRVRYQLVDRILRFPPQQFRRIKPAEAASMIKDEVEPLGGFTGDAFVQPVMLTGQALMAMIFICVQNLWLGAVAGFIAGIQVAIIPRMRRRLIELGRQRQLTARELSGRIGELMDGISTIHAMDTTNYERADISARLGRIFKIRYDLYQWKFMVKFLNNFLAQITPFVFYSFGGYLTIKGELDVGQLVAVINAYKDLPGPLKELIDWDQARQDVRVKCETVVEQFRAPMLIDERLHCLSLETGALGAPLTASALEVQEDGAGEKLLDRVSLSFAHGETVAMIDNTGSGAEVMAAVMGRAVWPTSGRMTVAGEPIEDMPEYLLGRRITYITQQDYFFQGSLYDNLLYGLRHAPYSVPEATDALAARRARWELTEARASGNAEFPVDADWIDRALVPPTADGARDLDAAIVSALETTGLAPDVMGMGLRARLAPGEHEHLKSVIVSLRHRLRADQASGAAKIPIEHFDTQRYNSRASLGENLLFGELASPDAGTTILRSDAARKIGDDLGLAGDLFDLGHEMAENILELVGDEGEDETLFAQMPFLNPQDIPELRQLVARTHRGRLVDAKPDDRFRMLTLSLSYNEVQMRLGLLSDALSDKVVKARAMLAEALPKELRALITPYQPDTYNDAARVIENILFGKLARNNPETQRKLFDLIVGYLRQAGVSQDILRLGLGEDVGISGRRLNLAQRQRLSLARALIRQSEYYVLNKALSAVDPRQHEAIVGATLQALQRHEEKPAVIWVLSNTRMAHLFQRVIIFDRGSVEFDGSFCDLKAAQKSDSTMVFT